MSPDEFIALAGPVRHEANNLLAAISGLADLLQRSAANERHSQRATHLQDAAMRLTELLQAYLALAEPPCTPTGGTDGARVLAQLRPLLPLIIGPGRPVEIGIAPDLPRLAAAPAAILALGLESVRSVATRLEAGQGVRVSLAPAPGGVTLVAAILPDGAVSVPGFLAALPG